MARLGGQTIDLNPSVSQVGRGEPIEDTARVLSRYLNAVAIRTFAQSDLQAYADAASIPIINASPTWSIPARRWPITRRCRRPLATEGLTMTYVVMATTCPFAADCRRAAGSTCASAALPASTLEGEGPGQSHRSRPQRDRHQRRPRQEAVRGARAVYTDVWASMGQKRSKARACRPSAASCG